jgi:DNA processing protein
MLSSILLAISCLPISTTEKYVLAKENPSLQRIGKMRGYSRNRVMRMLSFLAHSNTKVCFYGMREYPKAFFELENPPFRLMYNKSLPKEGQRLLTLSGTRHPCYQSSSAAYAFSLDALANDVALVCSNSQGIDRCILTACHDSNAQAFVLCDCGLACSRIQKNALVCSMNMISAFEPDDEALPINCLSRNVLSASLSEAALIMQAPRHSGALHVASMALDQGKDVFVHESATRNTAWCEGSRSLVDMGAPVVDDFADLACLMDWPCRNTVFRVL